MTLILLSCSKSDDLFEKPQPVQKSITFLHHYIDKNLNYVKTDTALHYCRVCCEDLARFESYETITYYCNGTNDIMELRIEKACDSTK